MKFKPELAWVCDINFIITERERKNLILTYQDDDVDYEWIPKSSLR